MDDDADQHATAPEEPSGGRPELSVVLPTLNEAGNLEPLVRQIREALAEVVSEYEIVVVEGGSSDDTAEVARRLGCRVIEQTTPGFGGALREGFRAAAADFVLTEMVRDGALLRTYRGTGNGGDEGISKLPAYLNDYAEMANALVDLYETTFDFRWLDAADRLAGRMVADFWDEESGGFFYTGAVHKNLLVRTKPFYDGAVPSGNSTATLVLLRLSKLLDNAGYYQKAEAVSTSTA